MIKHSFLSFLILLCTSSYAQDDIHLPTRPNQFFLGLTSGELIQANTIKYKTPSFGKKHFLVNDTDRYEHNQVKFYKDETGYYKRGLSIKYGDQFYKRGLSGKHIETYSYSQTYYVSNGSPYGGGTFQTRTFDYYSKNGAQFKKVTLPNLQADLSDNPASMASLQKVKSINGINIGLHVAGGALFLAGVIATANEAKKNENLPPSQRDARLSPLIFVGAITFSIPFLTKGSKSRKMYEALELYNN